MKSIIKNAMTTLGFDPDAITSLERDGDLLFAVGSRAQLFRACKSAYEADHTTLNEACLDQISNLAKESGVSPYSAHLLLFLLLSEPLREKYRDRGIDDTVWHNSMLDLKWKLWECRAVKGIWGTFVPHWFLGFFHMTRFALGRLQFEIVPCKGIYEKDGIRLTTESDVINVHIPRTCTPLDRESCLDAYRQASRFFQDHFQHSPMAFVCHSWLLYPPTKELLSPRSNIRTFMEDYDVIFQMEDPDGKRPNAWRLFDMDDTGNVEDYPEDSSLRRAFKEHLRRGGKMGSGYGVFLASTKSFL